MSYLLPLSPDTPGLSVPLPGFLLPQSSCEPTAGLAPGWREHLSPGCSAYFFSLGRPDGKGLADTMSTLLLSTPHETALPMGLTWLL